MMINEIEKLFIEEVREKKKAANGVHGKTGLRGYVGKMLFPHDLLSRKEKSKYKKASKVMSYNFKQIMPLVDFQNLEKNVQKDLLEAWRKLFPVKEIKEKWSMNDHYFYKLLNDLGIATQRTKREKPKDRIKRVNAQADFAEVAAAIQEDPQPLRTDRPAQLAAPTPAPKVEILPPRESFPVGLTVTYHGEYETQDAINRLMKIATLIEGEEKKYRITIKLEELE